MIVLVLIEICEFGFAGKLIMISNNIPPLRKSEIEYYAMLAKVPVIHFSGSKYLLWALNIIHDIFYIKLQQHSISKIFN